MKKITTLGWIVIAIVIIAIIFIVTRTSDKKRRGGFVQDYQRGGVVANGTPPGMMCLRKDRNGRCIAWTDIGARISGNCWSCGGSSGCTGDCCGYCVPDSNGLCGGGCGGGPERIKI